MSPLCFTAVSVANLLLPFHFIGVCLPANQHSKCTFKKIKSQKPLRTSRTDQTDVSAMFDNHEDLVILTKYIINKPFTLSSCFICVSYSVHLILTYYVRKGSWAFLNLNYPQINEVRKSDHVVATRSEFCLKIISPCEMAVTGFHVFKTEKIQVMGIF